MDSNNNDKTDLDLDDSDVNQANENNQDNKSDVHSSFNNDNPSIQKPTNDPRDQEEQDKDMMTGIELFMQNKFKESESLFQLKSTHDPLYALGTGALYFVKALMTFNETDIQIATKHLDNIETIANKQIQFYEEPLTMTGVAHSVISLPFQTFGSILRLTGINPQLTQPSM